jgi:hypothetical protein
VTATVEVRKSDGGDTPEYEVTVVEGTSRTAHQVTLDESDFERLRRGNESPEQFLGRCFEFLLARESKEAILGSFDVSVIARYFPDFEEVISG